MELTIQSVNFDATTRIRITASIADKYTVT